MDANTYWDHKDITTLKGETGLLDLMQTANPGESPPPTTYDQGDLNKGNIDIALGCEDTANALLAAGFYEFYHQHWSNHRLGELCFDSRILLGKSPKIPQRKGDINLQYPKHTEKCLATLDALRSKSKTLVKLSRIESYLTSNDPEKFKKGVKQACDLMERASAYMIHSKQVAVPKVTTVNPWSVTLAVTGVALRDAT